MTRKFYTLDEFAESLAISMLQMRALIKRGDIEGIQIGGHGQGRRQLTEERLLRQF